MIFEWDTKALKELKKISSPEAKRIDKKLEEIMASENPLSYFEPLIGDLSEYYKVRVGDYRVINIFITDETAHILKISKRGNVYSNQDKQQIIKRAKDIKP